MKNEDEKNFKKVGDYSPEELKQFQEVFAADLKQWRANERRIAHPALVILLVGLAAIICACLLSQPPIAWLFRIGFLIVAAGMVAVVIAVFSLTKLK